MDNEGFKDLWKNIIDGKEVSDDELYEALVADAEKRDGDLQRRRNVVEDLDLDTLVEEPKPKEGLI